MDKKRPPIPQSVRFNVLRRDNFQCRYCGRPSPDVTLHLDHVRPYSSGGTDTEDNLVTACQDCNYGKGAKVGVTAPVTTAAERKSQATGFVGLFGHSYREGKIQYQFHVVRQVSATRYGVQLFSWFTGEPTDIEVWDEDRLADCKFYPDPESWNDAYERVSRQERMRAKAEQR